ncbi:hypothetical protein DSL72_003110 [Monilinia vaccinii-corymbosi]|uniref:Uncharacterized protein n=1 Tax=Monilinia vaccinii-corymbosi TaxID=61207 RepID=A0A8A3P1D8_9HELO|nr:hypothetical protein DSL72_003110 [Monilinia vaccinii-corymbosi]
MQKLFIKQNRLVKPKIVQESTNRLNISIQPCAVSICTISIRAVSIRAISIYAVSIRAVSIHAISICVPFAQQTFYLGSRFV